MYSVVFFSAFVMFLELCEMGNLKDWVRKVKKITPDKDDEMLHFSADIVNGLKHLHSHGVSISIISERLEAPAQSWCKHIY